MKSKISQAAKKSVSLLLAILMMFSMLTVAMTVTVNAATNGVFAAGETIYFDFTDITEKNRVMKLNADKFSYSENNGSGEFNNVTSYTVIKATLKSETNLQNTANAVDLFSSDASSWQWVTNKDATAPWSKGKNCIKISANRQSFTWETYGSTTDNYTVTVGSTTGGVVELVSTSPAAANTQFEFKVKANDGYQIGTVTLSDGTTPTTDGIVDSNGYTHYTFTMPSANVTINATFTSTATSALTELYFYQNSGSSNLTDRHFALMDKAGSNFKIATTFPYNFKFKLVSSQDTNITPVVEDSSNYSVSKRTGFSSSKVSFSDSLVSAGASVSVDATWGDITFIKGNSTATEFVVEYTPDGDTGLDGSIKIWTKTDYDAAHGTTPTADIKIKPTSLKNMGVSEVAPITATHPDTCAGTLTWTVSEGTDVIKIDVDKKDPFTYKVTALKPGTAKITITCSESGKSVECPVEVKRLPFAETGRIYAYAGRTAPTDATLVSDAWIAAEKANNQLSIYGDNSSSAEKDAVKNYPTLGAASENNLCIYLPSSAATDKVTLYNASAGDLKVGEVTIASGDYGEVSYQDGTSQNITLNGASKTLTIYRSNATGALYLNNNSDNYVGNDSNGVPEMIKQLYSGKDTGEIGKNSGNYGAYTDKDGTVKFAGVSKVKGRGNSTWRYTDKKSFNVTFTDKFEAFGFTQGGKKYSLLANYKDPSLSRNKILYQLGKDVFGAKYVPKTATVDLYMNGLYMGSYLMCQKVEVGSKEVVDDVDDATLFENLYTGVSSEIDNIKTKGFSFLMEIDSNASDGSSTTDPDYYTTATDGKKLTIKEPEYGFPDDPGDYGYNASVDNAIKEFVKSKYNRLKEALNNTSITYDELNAIVDVDSLTRYFLLNEFAKNYDIGVTSTYFVYKCTLDAEGKVNGGKFYASPVWDLDVTASNCEKTNNYYSSYENDWTNDNSDWNVIMKAVFGNPVIQNAADAIWTPAFYTTLTNNIKTLATKAKEDLEGSYENNFRKWTYPYDFNGQGDNVQAHTRLEGGLATFNVSNAAYTKTESYDGNSYSKTAREGGQIDFLEDWLLSRAAWMTKKYNETITSTTQDFYIEQYYDASGGTNGSSHYEKMDYDEVNGTYSYEVNFAAHPWTDNESDSTVYRFGIVTEIDAARDEVAKSVTAYKSNAGTQISSYVTISDTTGNLTSSGVTLSTHKDVDLAFADSSADLTYIVTYKPGAGNILDGQITITKKSTTTTSDPKVSITGSTLTEIKVGAKVDITATVTPVMINGVAQAGDYTVTLLRNGSAYESKIVTFSDATPVALEAENSQTVTFKDVQLETEKDVFTATVSATIDGQSYSASAQTPVEYINAGARDQKIYFDPSGKTGWKGNITADSVVTMTVNGVPYKMYIDSEEKYALEKGVFRTDISQEALEYIKANGVTFTMEYVVNETTQTVTETIPSGAINSSNIKDGSIYTLTDETETGKNAWSDYNVAPVEKYPFGVATYEDFVTALNANQTQRILYFDNSVSGWHNVYFYGWDGAANCNNDTLPMNKIPNTDVWYIDFDNPETEAIETAPTANFLFKDRAGKPFGTDYQQTVDLVGSLKEDGTSDNYVLNAVGEGEKVYLYFTSTYEKNDNPIFITSTFYNCTTKNAANNNGSVAETMLKYRAFNTEWKNYALVLQSAVKTKSVEIYFDLHDKATVDSITIYHNSINDTAWKFPAEFTRLNRIGTSTIYRGTVALPYYTDNNELKRHFNFTKFVIGDKEYEIAENGAGQPTAEFINTGKIWFEINKNVVSTGASAKTSLYATGANVSTVSTGYSLSNASLSFVKPDSWTNVRLVIGTSGWRMVLAPTSNNGNVYTFSGITCSNYDGFCFVDTPDVATTAEAYDYLKKEAVDDHSTYGIRNQISGVTYRLVSGDKGALEVVPGNNVTVIYVPTSLTVNGTAATRLYAWDSNNNAILGSWDDTKTNITDNATTTTIDGTEYKVFILTHDTSTFSFKFSNSSKNETDNMTGVDSFKAYKITSSNINTSDKASYEEYAKKISLSATSTELDVTDGSQSTTITATPTGGLTGTVTFSITGPDGADTTGLLVDNGDNTATFTATNTTITGSYVITATAGGVTKTITITVTDSSVSVTDYCNIISYNTASANFSATNGGTVSNINAIISNGYYSDGSINTGYTEVQSDGSVTLYYALVNGTTGPVVKFTATTNHANEGTGNGQYSFDGWEKDGTLIADAGIVTDKTVTDSIKTVNTVNYVANWSLEQYVKFTFTYNYKDQDYKTAGMEYNPGNTSDYSYEVTVMVSQADASDAAKVQELYLNYQPKITSDYYTYAFDKKVSYSYTAGALTGTASSTATNTAKVYKLLVKNSVGDLVPLEKYSYFYQNLVQLTATPSTSNKTIEWKNNGLVIGYGNNIAFRITDTNTVITYTEIDATVASDRTVLHQPTYEFFVENNVEKVRFNFLVENKVQDLSKVELGVLYFFTDKDGANSTVYPGGANIPEDVLKAAATSGAKGINKKVITYANFKGEYIFNAKISNTEANKQKYLRVYSYIKEKTTGKVILSDTTTPVIASISYATAT